ncbi:MAG: vitamin K epoxide reductase family protein [Rhodothermales bacterium]|nr:vitamin K epoxide reductase family protein [Rhodothermales bacterium]
MARTANIRPLGVYRPVLDTAVFVLGLIGILVVVHLWIQSGRGFDRGCFGFSSTAATVECEAVTRSDAGMMLGVSNVIWGLIFYIGLTILSFATVVVGLDKLESVKRLRAAAIGVGFLYSVYLVYVQVAQIGEFCKLCMMSASIVAILLVLQIIDLRSRPQPEAASEGSSSRVKMFVIMLGAVVILSGVDVLYFGSLPPLEATATAAAQSGQENVLVDDSNVGECHYDPEKPLVENYRDLVTFSDPSKGNPDASVTVIEFFDPNCPHCATLHPIMEQVVAEYGERAWFVWRPFVLWEYSVSQVEAMYFAAQDNKFFEMMEEQFRRQRQGGIGIDELGEIATQIGLDGELMKTRLSRGLYRNIIMRQRQSGVDAGITSVPAVMINGRFVQSSSKTAECLGQLIDAAAR